MNVARARSSPSASASTATADADRDATIAIRLDEAVIELTQEIKKLDGRLANIECAVLADT